MQGFATLTGAGVPPRLTGHGGGGDSDELGGEILDFKFTGFELFGLEQILGAREAEGVGCAVTLFAGEQ